jgi:hypothetical protein
MFARGKLRIVVSLLALLAMGRAGGLAQVPDDETRFRWVEGVERLRPREYPNQLSQPTASDHLSMGVASSPSGLAVDFEHYPSSAETRTFMTELEALYPHLVETYEVGHSWQDRTIVGLRLGNEQSGDPELRPALYLDGQHHAREAISQQVVLYTIWHLLSNYGSDPLATYLLDTRTVYAIPSVNVDGNDIFLSDDFSQRRTANPSSSDDDTDEEFDEDPANGMGYGTYAVYRYYFKQEWAAAHPDDPFAPGWVDYYDRRVYLGVFDGEGNKIAQADEDDDGKTNEDPDGGVDPNRNYHFHWELGEDDPRSTVYRGPAPWSEPETGAVQGFVLGRQNIISGLTYHSGADLILHPWAWSDEAELEDILFYELMSRKGTQLTESYGFMGSPHTWAARGLYVAPGTAMDWLYSQGVYAWTPETYGASVIAFTERIDASGSFRVGLSEGVAFNPDPEDILPTVQRWNLFNVYILAATPNVGLTGASADNGLLTLTVANDGFLPVAVDVAIQGEGGHLDTASITYLQASEQFVTLTYPVALGVQTVAVTLTARSLIGTSPGEVEVESVVLGIKSGIGPEEVTVIEGQMADFVDLAGFFADGSWLAPGGWDLAGQYHLGPEVIEEVFFPCVF